MGTEANMATGKNKKNKRLSNVFDHLTEKSEESSMNINNLTETQITQLIQSMEINPNIEPHIKEPTLQWCRVQLEEQKAGGAWKARLREAGYTI